MKIDTGPASKAAMAAHALLAVMLLAVPAAFCGEEGAGAAEGAPKEGEEAPKKEEPRFLSDWGRIVLDRCERVSLGHVAKVLGLPNGLRVATFDVSEVLFGRGEKGESLLVLTTDPHFFNTGDELLLFLVPEGSGDGRFRTLDKIDVKAATGETQLEMVRRFLKMEEIDDMKARRAAFKKILFENLALDERWCRENAIRELYIFTEREPGEFTPEDVKNLRDEALARKSKTAQARLEYAAAHIEMIPPLVKAAGKDAKAAKEGLAEISRLLGEIGVPGGRIQIREDVIFEVYRSKADPAVRAGIVEAASELGRPRLLVGVMKALGDADVQVRLAALKGVRRHAPARSARIVAKLLNDSFPEVRREAALTLAVVGTPEDLPALRALAGDEAESEEVRKAAREAIEAIDH